MDRSEIDIDRRVARRVLDEGWIGPAALGRVQAELVRRRAVGESVDLAGLLGGRGLLTQAQLERLGPGAPARPDPVATVVNPEVAAGRFEGGESFGRYRDAHRIGAGGMGTVLRATDPALGRQVAIKILNRPAGGGDRVRERFLREARITGQLDHPNIPPVHELGATDDGRDYFAMKLVTGTSLDRILAAVRAETDPEARQAHRDRLLGDFLKVCDAVAHAHARGVVHRDLKPANVMVAAHGEILVVDWGLARVLGDGAADEGGRPAAAVDPGGDPALTAEGSLLGTPVYMAPEQAEGEAGRAGAPADVYSLGAVLYEMLTLARPFVGQRALDVVRQVVLGQLVRPSVRAPEASIPAELEAVVLKAMARRPADRYPSVEALAADVEAFRAGGVLAAAHYSPWRYALKWARRRRHRLAAAAAVVVALAAGVVAAGVVGRARAADRATTRFESASTGESVAFDPADPDPFFDRRLARLDEQVRAVRTHPSPPEAWSVRIADSAAELEGRAIEIGNWSLARVLARSVVTWGVVGDDEGDRRLARVASAERAAGETDRRRLGEALERIREAEAAGADGEFGRFVPGEAEERARRLAGSAGPALADEVLARLEEPADLRTPLVERFLIDVLGRTATPRTAAGESRPVERMATALDEAAAGRIDADLAAAWIEAAGRYMARWGEDRRLVTALGRLEGAAGEDPIVGAALERVAAADARALPAIDRPEAFGRAIVDRADRLAGSVRARPVVAAELLALAGDPAALSTAQLGFVYDLIGLLGLADGKGVLRAAFEALPAGWIPDDRPAGSIRLAGAGRGTLPSGRR